MSDVEDWKCPNDSDGDNNCHLCYRSGHCFEYVRHIESELAAANARISELERCCVVGDQEVFDNSKSLSTHRLISPPRGNLELEFSHEWLTMKKQEEMNNTHYENQLLATILSVPCSPLERDAVQTSSGFIKHPIGVPTERDEIVAASVIQWLGTNVGQNFIERVMVSPEPVPEGEKT